MTQPADLDYKSLPKVEGAVKLLWASDWYDGPLSGMCEYAGERLHFQYCHYDDGGEYHYILWRLTSEQRERLELRQAAFEKYVGTHYSYIDGKKRDFGGVRPESEWSKFYDVFKDEPVLQYDVSQAVGWCTEGAF